HQEGPEADHQPPAGHASQQEGLRKILKVVGQVPDLPSCLPLTDNTRMLASILINKLYDDLRCDPERDHFRKICEEYITGKFDPQDMDKNLNAIQTVSGILQGPFDLGNQLLGLKGVMEMMVAVQYIHRHPDRRWAVEGLAYLTLDADVKDDFVQDIPALQAMFELAKASVEESGLTTNLRKVGRESVRLGFWNRHKLRIFVRQLLFILSELLLEGAGDTAARLYGQSLSCTAVFPQNGSYQLHSSHTSLLATDKTILYSVATTLVNCTNSYDVKEVIPELVQLAKFSKQHVPEEHR
ncbi:hypothetical protein H8958_014740, partial [Nasalis larvatus]